jgi:hypothetical protein
LKKLIFVLALSLTLLAGCGQTTTSTVPGPTMTPTTTSVATTTVTQPAVTVSAPAVTTTLPPSTSVVTQPVTTTVTSPPQTVVATTTVTATPPPATTAITISDYNTIFPAAGTVRAESGLEGKVDIRYTDIYILPDTEGDTSLSFLVAVRNNSDQDIHSFSYSYTIKSGDTVLESSFRAYSSSAPTSPLILAGGVRVVVMGVSLPSAIEGPVSVELILESASFTF